MSMYEVGDTVYVVVDGYSMQNLDKYHIISRRVTKVRRDGKLELDSPLPWMRYRVVIPGCTEFYSSQLEALNAFSDEVEKRIASAMRELSAAQAASSWVADKSIELICGPPEVRS